MPGPVFARGERIELRTIEDEDYAFIQEHANAPGVRPWIGIQTPTSRETHQEWVEADDGVGFLVCVDGDPVGYTWLFRLDRLRGSAELGYWIAPDHQGNGFASEAAGRMVDYAFTELGLHRVQARYFEGNEPSRRVMERIGFEREGCLRESGFVDGERVDVPVYGLLADEWRERG